MHDLAGSSHAGYTLRRRPQRFLQYSLHHPDNQHIYTEIKNTDKGLPCVLVLISNTRPGCFPSPELLRARQLQQLPSCWPVCTWSTDASVIANDARCNLRIPHPEPKRNGSAWKRQISIICPLWRVADMPAEGHFWVLFLVPAYLCCPCGTPLWCLEFVRFWRFCAQPLQIKLFGGGWSAGQLSAHLRYEVQGWVPVSKMDTGIQNLSPAFSDTHKPTWILPSIRVSFDLSCSSC